MGSDYYKKKDDKGKTRFDLIDFGTMKGIADVLEYGLEKYGAKNSWKTIENPVERYTGAFHRHFIAHNNGVLFDDESGLPHLSHAMCNLYFLSYFESIAGVVVDGKSEDDSRVDDNS